MYLFKFSVQRQYHVALLRWINTSVVNCTLLRLTRILLSGLNHCQILLRQQVYDDFIRLFLFHSGLYHLDKDVEFLKVSCLVRDLFNVLLLEIASPDQALHLRFHVDDHSILRVEAAHLED